MFRAFTADRERPHVSDATSFWRQVSEKQLTDLLERLVRLLLPNGLHQAGLESAMHAQFLRVRTDVRPLQVGYVNPLGQGYGKPGKQDRGLFYGICILCIGSMHTLPYTGRHTGRLRRSSLTPSIPRPRLHDPSPPIVQQAIVQRRRGRAGAARTQTPDAEGQPGSGCPTPRSLRAVLTSSIISYGRIPSGRRLPAPTGVHSGRTRGPLWQRAGGGCPAGTPRRQEGPAAGPRPPAPKKRTAAE